MAVSIAARITPGIQSFPFLTPNSNLIETYLFKFLANHGNYDQRAGDKILLKVEGKSNKEIVELLARLFYRIDLRNHQRGHFTNVLARGGRLLSEILTAGTRTHFRAPEGQDLVANSGSNYYGEGLNENLLETELKDEYRRHITSYPYINSNNKVDARVARIGDRFSDYLKLIDNSLAKASVYATEGEKNLIAAHRKALRTGDPQDIIEAESIWVQNKSDDIDFVLGFIETYGDPLGIRASWEGVLLLKEISPETVKRIGNIRKNADYFEAHAPVEERFKKEPGFTPPQAEGAFLVASTGDNGEKPFSGVNLPNYKEVQEKYGSKSFTALNVMYNVEGTPKDEKNIFLKAFYQEKYQDLISGTDDVLESSVQVEFHEILGHGSTKNLPGVKDADLAEFYSPLEEGRAETASLYHGMDLKIRDFDIIPSSWTDEQARNFSTAMVLRFFTNHINSYYKLPEGAQEIHQAHQWARQMMLTRLIEDGALAVIETAEGIPQVELLSFEKVRETLGKIWWDLQNAKSTGSYAEAQAIFQKYGRYTDLHRKWRKAIVEARKKLNLPKEVVFTNPEMVLVKNEAGEVTDVQLDYLDPIESQYLFDALFSKERKRYENIYKARCELALKAK